MIQLIITVIILLVLFALLLAVTPSTSHINVFQMKIRNTLLIKKSLLNNDLFFLNSTSPLTSLVGNNSFSSSFGGSNTSITPGGQVQFLLLYLSMSF